jgi:hypothetical protein
LAVLKELWSLFVDDRSLALALVIWVAICGFGLSRAPVPAAWDAPILFVGCLVILVFNVMRSAQGKGK